MVSVLGPNSHNDIPETIYFTAYYTKAVPGRKQAPIRTDDNGVEEYLYPPPPFPPSTPYSSREIEESSCG